MNRRGFFNSLSLLTGATLVAPQIFLPKLEHTRWKRTTKGLIVPNPAYANAIYEMSWMVFPHEVDKYSSIVYPVRGNELDSKGNIISIPPFILT